MDYEIDDSVMAVVFNTDQHGDFYTCTNESEVLSYAGMIRAQGDRPAVFYRSSTPRVVNSHTGDNNGILVQTQTVHGGMWLG